MVRSGSRQRRPIEADTPYWINPVYLFPLVILPTTALFVAVPAASFETELGVIKQSTSVAAASYLFALAMLMLGLLSHDVFFGLSQKKRGQVDRFQILSNAAVLRRIGTTAAVLAILAHLYLFGTSGINLDAVMGTLRGDEGAVYELKDSLEKTSGITSFVNLAPIWYVYIGYNRLVLKRKLTTLQKAVSIVLFMLTVVRGLSTNERRAIIEILIPAVIVVIISRVRWSPVTRWVINIAPLVGPFLLFLLFFSTEYWRTWLPAYSKTSDLTYLQWVLVRFSGYYVTSINNGIATIIYDVHTYGYYTFNGVYRFPVFSTAVGLDDLRSAAVWNFTMMLYQYLNPEFNNQGGVIVPIIDFGYVMGGLVLAIVGFVCRAAYRSAHSGRVEGLLFYPLFFFAALEAPRVWSIGSAQSVLQILFLVLMLAFNRLAFPQSKVAQRNSRAAA